MYMKQVLRAVLLSLAVVLTLLALLAPPVVNNAAAAPTCNIEEMTNSQGQTCWVCVVGGDGADCECGGKLCFL